MSMILNSTGKLILGSGAGVALRGGSPPASVLLTLSGISGCCARAATNTFNYVNFDTSFLNSGFVAPFDAPGLCGLSSYTYYQSITLKYYSDMCATLLGTHTATLQITTSLDPCLKTVKDFQISVLPVSVFPYGALQTFIWTGSYGDDVCLQPKWTGADNPKLACSVNTDIGYGGHLVVT